MGIIPLKPNLPKPKTPLPKQKQKPKKILLQKQKPIPIGPHEVRLKVTHAPKYGKTAVTKKLLQQRKRFLFGKVLQEQKKRSLIFGSGANSNPNLNLLSSQQSLSSTSAIENHYLTTIHYKYSKLANNNTIKQSRQYHPIL